MPESKTTRTFRPVRQVAASVCCLRLHLFIPGHSPSLGCETLGIDIDLEGLGEAGSDGH